VAGPVAAGNLAIVISVAKSGDRSLDAINPLTNTIVWSHPYSPSDITPGLP
jgi:hypothetical protein